MTRGRFYLRCDHNEWELLGQLEGPPPFDAAVISDRYLAAYPKGHRDHGKERDRLVTALGQLGSAWSVDPDTARLGQPRSEERQRSRAANRPLAKRLPIALTAAQLSDPEAAADLVEAAATHQLSSRVFAAPYLEAASVDDPRFKVNVDLVHRARQQAGDRIVAAYLQTLRRDLLNGNAIDMLKRLADAGADVVFVRVRRFTPEEATTPEALAYCSLVRAAEQHGVRAVPDCVGRLGPALVAAGADAFTAGAWAFRKVPDDLHPAGGGGGAGALVWERPVTVAAEGGCSAVGCLAPTGPTDEHGKTRVHNLHVFRDGSRLAAAERFAYAARLLTDPATRPWGMALQELERRAA
jgi:hypothetical protein